MEKKGDNWCWVLLRERSQLPLSSSVSRGELHGGGENAPFRVLIVWRSREFVSSSESEGIPTVIWEYPNPEWPSRCGLMNWRRTDFCSDEIVVLSITWVLHFLDVWFG
jgi:hypothetical protein